MVRFSLDGEGYDHGEGSSNPKRQKTSFGSKEAQFRREAVAEEEEVVPEHEEAASVEGEDEDEDEDEGEGEDEDEDEGEGEGEDEDEDEGGASVGNGPTRVFLLDPYVFDCSICFEPLRSPVFQEVTWSNGVQNQSTTALRLEMLAS